MRIVAENISKRFNRDWIFNQLTIDISDKSFVAITGTNGSGKSTLLQILASLTVPTTGTVSYFKDNTLVEKETAPLSFSYVAPYQELIEEMTLHEFLQFHFSLRKGDYTTTETFMDFCGISKSKNKEIRYFSSGMKQRVKLGLAFQNRSDIIFLDEPTSYLDEQGISWFQKIIQQRMGEVTLVMASNIPLEYQKATQFLNISK